MTLQNQVLTLINTNGFKLPLEILELNKYCYNNIIIPKKFKLNNENKDIMKNIKDMKEIIMSDDFNKPLILPDELESIIFGVSFNQPLILHEGLKKIDLGHISFDIKNEIVINIKCCCFNQTLILPKTIEYIKFNYNKDFLLFNSSLLLNGLMTKDIEIKYDNIKLYRDKNDISTYDYYINSNLLDKYDDIKLKNRFNHIIKVYEKIPKNELLNLVSHYNEKVLINEIINLIPNDYPKTDYKMIIIKDVTKTPFVHKENDNFNEYNFDYFINTN
jgi:hypothetical protein